MLIGARTGAWSGGAKWKNPYITDGLVAMWDGEWNAGGGVHDSGATVWKDLVGVNDMTNLTSEWGQDHLKVMRVNGEIVRVPIPPTGTREFSFEMVVQMLDGSSTAGRYIGLGSSSEMKARYLELDTNNFAADRFSWYRNTGSFANRAISRTVDSKSRHSMSLMLSDTAQSGCVNGSGIATTTSYIPNDGTYEGFVARLGEYNNSSLANLNAFCLRVYSRALTAEEIAHNYAVDKERFGLP